MTVDLMAAALRVAEAALAAGELPIGAVCRGRPAEGLDPPPRGYVTRRPAGA